MHSKFGNQNIGYFLYWFKSEMIWPFISVKLTHDMSKSKVYIQDIVCIFNFYIYIFHEIFF